MTNFLALLSVLFIGLKLTGHITWSWIWVLSPIWIFSLYILSLFILIIINIEVSRIRYNGWL